MASEVEIANRALSKLGEARITSMDDNNKAARAMKARFALLRDAEVSASAWGFAVKRTNLAASTDVPEWGYARIFERPVDDMRPLMVDGYSIDFRAIGVMNEASGYSTSTPSYQFISNKIYTDLSAPLKYEYIGRVTDTGQFDPLFVEVLACRLAVDAAEELTQSASKGQVVADQYRLALGEAKRTHALWEPPRIKGPNRFLLSRAW